MIYIADTHHLHERFKAFGFNVLDLKTYLDMSWLKYNWGLESVKVDPQYRTVTFYIKDKKKFLLKILKYGICVNESK